MGLWRLRMRRFVGNHLWSLAVTLVVLAVAGGFIAHTTYVDPGEAVQTEEVSEWSSQGGFTHEATVIQVTDVFEEGTVLRDRSVYFMEISPVMDGTAYYSYEATDRGDLRVEGTITLRMRSVSETGNGNVTEYWHLEEVLISDTESSLSPGERMQIPFSLNISAVSQRINEIEDQLGGTPGDIDIALRSRFDIEGTRNGREIETTRTYETDISVEGNIYRVEGDQPEVDSGREVEEVTVQQTYGPLWRIGGPLLMAIGLVGLFGLVIGHRGDHTALSETEREWLQYRTARNEFDDWISPGWIPTDAFAGSRVTVDTLEDLVDVAIDSERRVIRDRNSGSYIVKVEDVVYTFTPPEEPRKPDRSGE